MKHIWKLAAIGLVAAVAFLIISFVVRIIVTVVAIGLLARLIYGMGRHSRSGMRPGHKFDRRAQYSMQQSAAVSIDGDDWFSAGRKQSSREQKITVF